MEMGSSWVIFFFFFCKYIVVKHKREKKRSRVIFDKVKTLVLGVTQRQKWFSWTRRLGCVPLGMSPELGSARQPSAWNRTWDAAAPAPLPS